MSREAARGSQQISVRTEWEEEEGGKVTAHYRILPSPGTHIIRSEVGKTLGINHL